MGKPYQALLLRGYTIAIIPWARPAHVSESGPLARLQVPPNSGSPMFMLGAKPCQREIATEEIPERKNYKEYSIVTARQKRACHGVSALTSSVPCKMAYGWQRVSATCEIQTHVTWLLQLALTTKPWVRIYLPPKMLFKSWCFAANFSNLLRAGLSFSECSRGISRPDNTREFLTSNLPLIHVITWDIDWSWNFSQCIIFCSMLIEQLIKSDIDLWKVRTENLKFRTGLGDWFILLVSKTVDDFFELHSMGLYVFWATTNCRITRIMSIPPKTTHVLLLRHACLPPDMPPGTARAPPQVPQHFDGARANGSLFAPPVASHPIAN